MPSFLSLTVSLLYLVTAALCFRVALSSRGDQPDLKRIWLMLGVFFVMLVLWRVFMIEELLRQALRALLRQDHLYAQRRNFQRLLAALTVVAASLAGFWLARRWLQRRLPWKESVALIGAASLAALIAIRLISFHFIDVLLYGPLKLNWVIDLGATVACGLAAYLVLRDSRRARGPAKSRYRR